MTTALDLITLALRNAGVNGVGQAPSADDTADCLMTLNLMLSQWARRRWLVFQELDLSLQSTGAASYSIGPSGDFVCARVDRLEGGYIRFNPGTTYPIDYPLTIIQSREDWSAIGMKSLQAPSCAVFLDSGYPSGTVYFWPVPSSQYELHILIKAPLVSVSNDTLTTDMALPPEYFEALLYNLAVRMFSMYQVPVRPDVVGLAKAALATIRSANVQIPQLGLPAAIIARRGTGGGLWAPSDSLFQTDSGVTIG